MLFLNYNQNIIIFNIYSYFQKIVVIKSLYNTAYTLLYNYDNIFLLENETMK